MSLIRVMNTCTFDGVCATFSSLRFVIHSHPLPPMVMIVVWSVMHLNGHCNRGRHVHHVWSVHGYTVYQIESWLYISLLFQLAHALRRVRTFPHLSIGYDRLVVVLQNSLWVWFVVQKWNRGDHDIVAFLFGLCFYSLAICVIGFVDGMELWVREPPK